MSPYMGIWARILAWVLWRLNGWKDPDECYFECIEHPELSGTASLARDYWYVRKARKHEEMGDA